VPTNRLLTSKVIVIAAASPARATGAGGAGASPWAAGAGLAWDVTVIAAKRDNRPFRLRPGVVRDESRARCRHILDRNPARHPGR